MVNGPAIDDVVDQRTDCGHDRGEKVEKADKGVSFTYRVLSGSVLGEEKVDAECLNGRHGSRS